jgi:hypothetical protein
MRAGTGARRTEAGRDIVRSTKPGQACGSAAIDTESPRCNPLYK